MFTSFFVYGQSSPDSIKLLRNDALNIYIDCNYCDQQYFKEHFTIVNYVRDRKEADVHLIITDMETGGGGTQFSIQFIGFNQFQHLMDTIVYSLPSNYTEEEDRTSMLKHMQLGLVPFVVKTRYADKLQLSIDDESVVEEEIDPWKNWVFSVYAHGSGWVEKSYSSYSVNSGLSVQKVTEEIKLETYMDLSYDESKYRLYENDSLIYSNTSSQRSYFFSNLFVKSLGEHFGIGGFFNINSNTFNNLHFRIKLSPAFEYNVFKYSEATTKQLRFLYALSYAHVNYYDTTIYNQMQEGLFSQELRIMFKYVADWGSVDLGVTGSNYLNDFSLYYIGSYVTMDIRIFKGLSFNLYGSVNIPRNQIGLKKGITTAEDVLTRQHEMETNYSLTISAGLSYTFGSIYNNVVNPRFDYY